MSTRLRAHISPAMMVALVALFIALGSVAGAASVVTLALYARSAGNANTVDRIHAARTPKPGTLLPLGADKKFAASRIRGPIDANTVDSFAASATPKPGTLLALGNDGKYPPSVIPSVVSSIKTRTAQSSVVLVAPRKFAIAVASCGPHGVVLGGGGGSGTATLQIMSTEPYGPTGWGVEVFNESSSGTTLPFTAVAVCLDQVG